MKNKKRNFLSTNGTQAGFTLIELIIVVAIVVIISAVTLGSLTRSQDQQIFNNSFEKLYSLINTARSLSIAGKGQLDYTDFDNDGCRAAATTVPLCAADYVTPVNYAVQFSTSTSPNAVLFADMNIPSSGATGSKGNYNSGTSYATGDDLDLDSLTLPAGITMEIQDVTIFPPSLSTTGIFYSPNYADITFSPVSSNANPFLLLRLKQGAYICKQIRIHKLAGIPEVELCTGSYL